MYANYAYVDSDVTEFAPESDPYTIVGLAKHTSQFDIFYNKGGFETRVAWKHHSPFTVAPGWVATVLKELGDEDLFDASVSYSWNDRYTLRLQGHNLTDERGLLTPTISSRTCRMTAATRCMDGPIDWTSASGSE